MSTKEWLTDPRLPVGFNNREALKTFLQTWTPRDLEKTLKRLQEQRDILDWRIELVKEVAKEAE